MKSALRGKTISTVEVSKVARDGFCLLVDERELFVPFKLFPWFADATIRQIAAVERPSPHHLRWPDLDVDLALASGHARAAAAGGFGCSRPPAETHSGGG